MNNSLRPRRLSTGWSIRPMRSASLALVVASVAAVAPPVSAGAAATPPTVAAPRVSSAAAAPTTTVTAAADGAGSSSVRGTKKLRSGKVAQWRVERTNGAYGTVCWRFVARPRPTLPLYDGPGGARCVLPPSKGDAVEDLAQVVAWNARESRYGVLVISTPRTVTRARVGFADRSKENLRAAGPGLFVVFSDRIPLIAEFTIRGQRVACSGGSIAEFPDLKDRILTRASIGLPYICDRP